jgi:uncharacterized repeat protein (TIGR03806 family)
MNVIGPKARHLNRDYAYDDGTENQLIRWSRLAILDGAPADPSSAPRAAVWDDPASGTLEARARAWLDVNCAHCHNPNGPARTSGMFLDAAETDPYTLGSCKAPVAAGLGSGGFRFDIVPGSPDSSIMVYRLAATDPSYMMPQIGRSVVHKESLQLIRDWIASLSGGCP